MGLGGLAGRAMGGGFVRSLFSNLNWISSSFFLLAFGFGFGFAYGFYYLRMCMHNPLNCGFFLFPLTRIHGIGVIYNGYLLTTFPHLPLTLPFVSILRISICIQQSLSLLSRHSSYSYFYCKCRMKILFSILDLRT